MNPNEELEYRLTAALRQINDAHLLDDNDFAALCYATGIPRRRVEVREFNPKQRTIPLAEQG